MICKEYSELEPLEQSLFMGKLVHAVSNDSTLYELGKYLIEIAEEKGLFEKVKFHPHINQETINH